MTNNSGPRVNHYLSWARTYLKRGGALENSARSVWALTETGAKILDVAATRAIYDQVTQEEKERAKAKRQKERDRLQAKRDKQKRKASEVETTSEEEPDTQNDWKSSLLDVMKTMGPDAFGRSAQRLLREAGFVKVEGRGKSGDGGIDGVAVLRVNLVSFQVYFQCKRYKGSVGSKEIRDFRGALEGRADKGLSITTSHFTRRRRPVTEQRPLT
ncbi:restriction endonuclease [Roseobacter sp. SK209-2-6]|uniref:restriction endonuclease n=1 Tax=Roseobacter sp. SK209-2-6 TaxID=388739 RepID=UPI0018DD404B|nr:restriction endonuclease [Roseobacter sp. SK209-2-6]